MRRNARLVVAALAVAAGITATWWFAGRVDRAISTLRYGTEEAQIGAMRLLVEHLEHAEAFPAVVEWFESAAHRNPAPGIMAEAARAFAGRKPVEDSFAAAVATLQIRGLFPEARTWVDDYQHSPAVTAALLQYLVTSLPGEWPGAEANLRRELRDRPKDAATLDLAIAAWRPGRRTAAVEFIQTFDPAMTETRVKATASAAAQGLDEWSLLRCQQGRCRSADIPFLINSVRTDAAASQGIALRPESVASADSTSPPPALPGRLDAQRAALVSLGQAAVPALLALYDDGSRESSSFAVATLVEIDEPALVSRLAPEIEKVGAPALKAIDALQATPADSHGANRLLMEALSSKAQEISDVALDALRRRLDEQNLVDGVLGYVANRDRFSQREVVAYENAIKSAGPKTGTYVAGTMTRMLDTAGDPRDVVWIQKVIALRVLRDVGMDDALPLLARLRRDPGGYMWITTTTADDGRQDESHRDIRFREASDDAIKAINGRLGNS